MNGPLSVRTKQTLTKGVVLDHARSHGAKLFKNRTARCRLGGICVLIWSLAVEREIHADAVQSSRAKGLCLFEVIASSENSSESVSVRCLRERVRQAGPGDVIAQHTVVPGEELRGQGLNDGQVGPTTPDTHPNGKIGCDAKPFKRGIGPPHCSEEGRIGGLQLGASFSRREEAEKVRESAASRSKRRSARTCSDYGRHLCARRQSGGSSPLAILGRDYGDRECEYAGREASLQAHGVPPAPIAGLLHHMRASRTLLALKACLVLETNGIGCVCYHEEAPIQELSLQDKTSVALEG